MESRQDAPLAASDVKARFAAVCDQAARGEVIAFTRSRGSKVERFELRLAEPPRRKLGAWEGKLSAEAIDQLTAPLTDEELAEWNI